MEKGQRGNSVNVTRAVDRAITILSYLAEGELPLADIARRTGLNGATAFRILYTLEKRGFVKKNEDNLHYSLGPKLLGLISGKLYHSQMLVEIAYPHMEHLWKLTGETINLYIRNNLSRICVAELVSNQPLKYSVGVGVSVPLYTGSAGKILLAYLPAGELEEFLNQVDLVRITQKTITNKKVLAHELETNKARGYSTSFGERIEGVSCLSAPVFSGNGRVMASLNILGPYARLGEQLLLSYLDELLHEARAISEKLAGAY